MSASTMSRSSSAKTPSAQATLTSDFTIAMFWSCMSDAPSILPDSSKSFLRPPPTPSPAADRAASRGARISRIISGVSEPRWEPSRPAVHALAIELTAFCNQHCDYCYNAWREDGGASVGTPELRDLLARIDRVLDAV